MSETSLDYFNREKKSRFDLFDYLDADYKSLEKLNLAKEILGGDINQYLEFEKDEDTGEDIVNPRTSDRDGIDEAIKNYYEPLSLERRVRVNPRDPSQVESYSDSKYKIMITYGGPNVFRDVDWTAELHLYRGGDHYSRDFGRDVADKLLSFYGLE